MATETGRVDIGPGARRFAPTYAVAVLLGLPGIASLLLIYAVAGIPPLALLVNPTLLLLALAAAGAATASRMGLRSRLILGNASTGAADLALALGLGALLGAVATLADDVIAPFWQDGLAFPSLRDAWSWSNFVIGVLYGGVTEEVVMRFGLLSAVAWALVRLAGMSRKPALVAATIVAAALFAASHIPSLLVMGAPPPELMARTLGFNLVLGLVFGAAYVRRDLEAAIVMHIGFHVGMALTVVGALTGS